MVLGKDSVLLPCGVGLIWYYSDGHTGVDVMSLSQDLKKLADLLEHPELGLSSWHVSCETVWQRIKAAVNLRNKPKGDEDGTTDNF